MILFLTMEGTKMQKKVSEYDFEETEGPMNKTSIYDALVYTGLQGHVNMSIEEYDSVLTKKRKMIRSDLKHQRAISKCARKMNWGISNEN